MKANSTVDNEQEFRALLSRPRYAWPTIALFVAMLIVFVTNTVVAAINYSELGVTQLVAAMAVNMICSYVSYTILHESAHGLMIKGSVLNVWIGRISMLLLTVTPFFYLYRHIHLQHHKHVNREKTDPDMFCARGHRYLLPFRWALMDLAYVIAFLRDANFRKKPSYVRREFILAIVIGLCLLGVITAAGWWAEFIVLYFIPARIALIFLAYCFDYIPHYPHDVEIGVNRFQTTNNRVGWEWLLTPLLLGQNYHLAHHIYPGVSFYRYRQVWRSRQSFHDSHKPRYVRAFRLQPFEKNA